MIKVIMTRTSEDYWYEIKTISSLEELLAICKDKGDLILKENWRLKDDPELILQFWDGMTIEDAKEASECKFEIEIYDDYRE